MKKYTFLSAMLFSFFLLSCDKGTSTTPSRTDAAMPNIQVKNEKLKQEMEEFKKTKKLRDSDTLLLVLDEGTESEPDQKKQIEILNFFIRIGSENIPQKAIYPVLFEAIEQKKNEVVEFLLNGVKLDLLKARDTEDRTLLHAAVVQSSPKIVGDLVLKEKELINTKSTNHGTPLHYVLAAPFKLGNKDTNDIATRTEIVNKLLQHHITKLNSKNPAKETAAKLAQNLAETEVDTAKKAFYTWAATAIKTKANKR